MIMPSKIGGGNKRTCTSVAGHFNGHAEALKQSTWHCPIQHVQGYNESHWMRPSGNYSLRIAPAAARATANKTKMQYVPTLMVILMAITMWRYYTARIAQWRRFVVFIKSTNCHHQANTSSNFTNRTCQHHLFLTFHHKKGLQLTCWALITIGVRHIKLMKRPNIIW